MGGKGVRWWPVSVLLQIRGWPWLLRDRAIDALFRVQRECLNDHIAATPAEPAAVAQELREMAAFLKAEAVDPATGRLDFAMVAKSEAYRRFRQSCTPRARGLDLRRLGRREERLAFWINCYNALLVDAVICYEIRTSVKEARGGLVGFFRRAAYEIGGYRFSLDYIEHGVLRANRGHPRIPGPHFRATDPRRACALEKADPRLHFVLNCGAASCPPIKSFSADRIDEELELAAAGFLNGPEGATLDRAQGTLLLPRVMSWYATDFGCQAGVVRFVARHLDSDADREFLQSERVKLRYREYDWSLG